MAASTTSDLDTLIELRRKLENEKELIYENKVKDHVNYLAKAAKAVEEMKKKELGDIMKEINDVDEKINGFRTVLLRGIECKDFDITQFDMLGRIVENESVTIAGHVYEAIFLKFEQPIQLDDFKSSLSSIMASKMSYGSRDEFELIKTEIKNRPKTFIMTGVAARDFSPLIFNKFGQPEEVRVKGHGAIYDAVLVTFKDPITVCDLKESSLEKFNQVPVSEKFVGRHDQVTIYKDWKEDHINKNWNFYSIVY